MNALSAELGAYLALVLAGFLPNEVWRWLRRRLCARPR